jgi:hypothetical protein
MTVILCHIVVILAMWLRGWPGAQQGIAAAIFQLVSCKLVTDHMLWLM